MDASEGGLIGQAVRRAFLEVPLTLRLLRLIGKVNELKSLVRGDLALNTNVEQFD